MALETLDIATIAGQRVRQIKGSDIFFYQAGMTINADGAPDAYGPGDSGIDNIENAGEKVGGKWNWWALALDASGNPVKQTVNGKTYYVSTTALFDKSKKETMQARYVNSHKVPFIVLPPLLRKKAKLRMGDFATVINKKNAKICQAVCGDVGGDSNLGEGSIALANALGIDSNPRSGGTAKDILYVIYATSGAGNGTIPSLTTINTKGGALYASASSHGVIT